MKKNNIKETKSINELLKEALIPEEEHPYKIPDNWVLSKLGKIVENSKGSKPKNLYSEFQEGLIPYINIKAFETGEFKEYTDYSNRLCNEDDILIVWDGARSGLVGKGVKGAVGSTLSKLTPKKINKEFVFKFLKMKYEYINTNGRGIGIPHVDPEILWSIPFPLPPLPEQQRIVEKLESMLGKIKQAKELIEDAKETFKNRKASILAKAFSGELTEKWRAENQNVMTAEELLEIIKNRRFTESKKLEQIKEIYDYYEKENFETLPNTWRLVTLEKVCEGFKYGTSSKSENEGLITVIRMGNLQNGKIDWNDLVYTSDKNEIEKYSLSKGDVLFNRTNSPELVGKTSIYKGEMPAIYAGYLIKILNYPELNSDFLNFFLNSHIAKHYCWNVKTDGVSQSNINAQKLAKFEMPLAPIEEQKEIVRIIENLLNKEDEALEKIESMEENLYLLEKSILSKALRGELGTNKPNEESSINLLKEILGKPENELTTKRSIKKKEVSIVMSNKLSLKNIISEKFMSKDFTFDELRSETKHFEYDELKEEFFDLLRNKTITQKFDEHKKIMLFQVDK